MAVIVASLLVGITVPAASLAAVAPIAPSPDAPAQGFRLIQANLDSPNSVASFRKDLATVLGQRPDFATVSEVGRRTDADLTVPGYSMWRTTGRYTGETAVMWRDDRWTATVEGTDPILEKPGVPKGRQVELGMRYANWVTLASPDGHLLSVVSVHFTPPVKQWGDLAPQELANLNTLTTRLSRVGPVLVGGDFNFNYAGSSYPRDLLTSYQLVPTFDLLGGRVATGDERGASIDYVLVRQAVPELSPTRQWATELISDHDALGTDWQFNSDAPYPRGSTSGVQFKPGTIVNRPHAKAVARRAVLAQLRRAIDHAPAGSAIHLSTSNLDDQALLDALLRADKRAVHVQVLVREKGINARERSLRSALGTDTTARTWFTTCGSRHCRKVAERMAVTTLLVSQSGQTPAVRITSNRPVDSSGARRPNTARTTTSLSAYNAGFHNFFDLIA